MKSNTYWCWNNGHMDFYLISVGYKDGTTIDLCDNSGGWFRIPSHIERYYEK